MVLFCNRHAPEMQNILPGSCMGLYTKWDIALVYDLMHISSDPLLWVITCKLDPDQCEISAQMKSYAYVLFVVTREALGRCRNSRLLDTQN